MSSIAGYRNAIMACEQRLHELRQERSGLEGFVGEVRHGSTVFDQQLGNKRHLARRAQQIGRSRIAARYGRRILKNIDASFQSRIQQNFEGMLRDAQRAIDNVNREIEQEEARIQQYQCVIRRIQEEERLARERAEAEARRAAQQNA
ncbi:MAG: hypothetical protein IKF14_01570 [Atopobiaceae bacterium]|nr:hypothetical protein [Atopobiaceae bacterium]